MALILNIDTATSTGSVCLSRDGRVLQTLVNDKQQDHAATMVVYVERILAEQGIRPSELDAVAVSAGPGSYTGLRVGVATAKGLCYTWEKPLLAISTLQLMAQGMHAAGHPEVDLYCPMLDARRMEVFTALYDTAISVVLAPQALILDEHTFAAELAQQRILFFGDGSMKWKTLSGEPAHALFADYTISAEHMIPLSEAAFSREEYADVAYFSPYYLKPFFHPQRR
ncbi:tRNA (adenosine(37)-N6)-threonylcarbamoyltransferase complex dimerization subunit type 1 TsaB [Chitinophaga pendula]|uniref:tRNA (adenosine(37)-N6)-threonylcarbamoyltransferase complex dimerization subunit type 1 TsaB n=1 Tax=Chitinophaga TaxID=79328 RepID=UPI0012FD30DF|nr:MULTISPECIES: tRNA (adenosine(37)-N6)-threonylcarbamoyltransferase complex dimerization subunit type 1 TsaB [Chitinophaga]UCJ06461.1 tRNA (adenosine(37)-N6)-threonylcarbamoyltransferase complex dimerization subunit type 1 TsaB [Chitinophaga pendula]